MSFARTVVEEDDEEEMVRLQFKVIVLGDGAVGKTSICVRFAENKYSQQYKQTIGCDFFVAKMNITPKLQVTLQLWDIGGQSIGSKMITNYISGAHAVLLCYDITNYDSFCDLEDWYALVVKTFTAEKKRMPYTALVGNKNDLRHMSAVRADQHSKFADENGMNSFLLSAKNGDQVTQAFHRIAATLSGVSFVTSVASCGGESSVNNVTVVPAIIVDHARHDDEVNEGKVPEYVKPNSYCSVS